MNCKVLLAALLSAFAVVGVSSCSNDDDDSKNDGGVFSGRKLQSYDDYKFVWNGNKVSKIISTSEGEGGSVREHAMTISYNGKKATINWDEECAPAVANLNDKGFISSWASLDSWGSDYAHGSAFSYDENGHLVSYNVDSTSGKINYNSDGDITSASIDGERVSFSYTDSNVSKPIENKGNLMLMSEWGIMWDWEYFYWFGIYGKATAHLPVKVGTTKFHWNLDKQGYPTSCEVEEWDAYEGESSTSTISFKWN